MRVHDSAHDWNQMHRRFRLTPPIQLYQIEADCWRLLGAPWDVWFSPAPGREEVMEGRLRIGPYSAFHLEISPECTTPALLWEDLCRRYPEDALLALPPLARPQEALCR